MIIGIMNHPDRPEPPWIEDFSSPFNDDIEEVVIYKEKHNTTREVLVGLLTRILLKHQPHIDEYILVCQDDITLGKNFLEAITMLKTMIKDRSIPMVQLFTYHIDLMSQGFGLHKTKPTSEEYYYLIEEHGERNSKHQIDLRYAAKIVYPRCYANLYSVNFALKLITEARNMNLPKADDMFVAKVMLEKKVPLHYVFPSFVFDTLQERVQNDEGFEDFKKHFAVSTSELNHKPIKTKKLIDRNNYFYPDLDLKELVFKWFTDEK